MDLQNNRLTDGLMDGQRDSLFYINALNLNNIHVLQLIFAIEYSIMYKKYKIFWFWPVAYSAFAEPGFNH